MSNRIHADPPSDPRKLSGNMAGPSTGRPLRDVVIDITNGVLLDNVQIGALAEGSPPLGAVALLLGGRINQTEDRANVVFLTGMAGIVNLMGEAITLYARLGLDKEFVGLMDQYMNLVTKHGLPGGDRG